jgi:hypothetical protein
MEAIGPGPHHAGAATSGIGYDAHQANDHPRPEQEAGEARRKAVASRTAGEAEGLVEGWDLRRAREPIGERPTTRIESGLQAADRLTTEVEGRLQAKTEDRLTNTIEAGQAEGPTEDRLPISPEGKPQADIDDRARRRAACQPETGCRARPTAVTVTAVEYAKEVQGP